MRPIRIHQGKSLPLALRLVCAAISCGGVFLTLQLIIPPWSLAISMLISLILPATWFANKLFEVDLASNKVFQGHWTMGFRWGQWTQFSTIEIVMQKEKIKPTEFSLPNNKIIVTDQEYRAYLQIDSGEQLYLFGHPLKERMEEKVQILEKKLSVHKRYNSKQV